MSDVVVISPAEMAVPLRLAGLRVLPARNAREAYEHVQDLRAHGETELVILPEHYLVAFPHAGYQEVLESDDPYFVPLPLDWRNTRDARADFESRLARILGCHVSVAARQPTDSREALP